MPLPREFCNMFIYLVTTNKTIWQHCNPKCERKNSDFRTECSSAFLFFYRHQDITKTFHLLVYDLTTLVLGV